MHRSPFPSSGAMAAAGLLTLFVIALLGVLRWLDLPSGQWVDWLVGIAGFWWLLGVTTIPWNVYFGARRVLHELSVSAERGIRTSERDGQVARKIASRALATAIILHMASATGFWALAHFGLTSVGWVGAAAALMLTFAQPLAHLYQHLVETLRDMSDDARYPRADIETLRAQVERAETLLRQLDTSDTHSWASGVERKLDTAHRQDEALSAAIREARQEMHQISARLSEDTQFLGNVRELIRFVKEA
jgi:hypothetical protein